MYTTIGIKVKIIVKGIEISIEIKFLEQNEKKKICYRC